MKRTATLLGATGLIGGHILELLQNDSYFEEVRVIVRRPLEIAHPKVKVVVIDFADEFQFKAAMEGSDLVFCAIGTTQKKVKGDKKLYRSIDFDIPINAAKHSIKYGCKQFLIVSSLGADSSKRGFYLKLKGEVEEALIAKMHPTVGFHSLSIFRPSLLLGDRKEKRLAEDIGQFFGKVLKFLMPGKSKPIEGENVAKAMVAAAKLNKKGVEIYHYKEMKELVG
ncbi:NAD(P)H-binding protein [Brumimicrobium sp.]|uniref:NAD(P)H-binding protein n=1 Tax=Brumimicrobium sp. TaxID=2029867 RepID=UPI003A9084B2